MAREKAENIKQNNDAVSIPKQEKECINDKRKMDGMVEDEEKELLKESYLAENCRKTAEEGQAESIVESNKQLTIETNPDPVGLGNTIDLTLECGLKRLSVSGSTHIDGNKQQVKPTGILDESAVEHEANKTERINSDQYAADNDNLQTVQEETDSKVRFFVFHLSSSNSRLLFDLIGMVCTTQNNHQKFWRLGLLSAYFTYCIG